MAKGNSVELKTFKSYGVENILGYKTEEKNGRTFVNFIWCKVCARNKEGFKKHPKLKGNTKTSAMAFVWDSDDGDEFESDDDEYQEMDTDDIP